MKKFPTIYKRTSKGQIQEWTITSADGFFFTEEGIQGGSITKSKPHKVEPKNVGRSNETTAEQQAELEAQSKWDKKLKTGYAKSVAEIDSVAFKKPMKGYKWEEQEDHVLFPVQVQDKLNGVRYQAERNYSRSTGGEIFWTTPHIREALEPIFKAHPDIFIDGEVFNFKLKSNLNRLTELVTVVPQPKDLTPELLAKSREIVEFMYLMPMDGTTFRSRLRGLSDMPHLNNSFKNSRRNLYFFCLIRQWILPPNYSNSLKKTAPMAAKG